MTSPRRSNDLAYICQHYGVPAEIGGRVAFKGRPGTIIGTTGHYLRVKLDDEKHAHAFHATWNIEYLHACVGCDNQIGGQPPELFPFCADCLTARVGPLEAA